MTEREKPSLSIIKQKDSLSSKSVAGALNGLTEYEESIKLDDNMERCY